VNEGSCTRDFRGWLSERLGMIKEDKGLCVLFSESVDCIMEQFVNGFEINVSKNKNLFLEKSTK
jgi:hypothetical protein